MMRAAGLLVALAILAGCTQPDAPGTSRAGYALTITENIGLFRRLTLRGPDGLVCRAPARPNSYKGPVRGTGTCNSGAPWSFALSGPIPSQGFRFGAEGEVRVAGQVVPARIKVDRHLGGLPFPGRSRGAH